MARDPQVVREWFNAKQQKELEPLARIAERVEEQVDQRLGEHEGTLSSAIDEDDPRHGSIHATVKLSESLAAELESLEPDQVEVIQAELRRRYLDAGFDALLVHAEQGEIQLGCVLSPEMPGEEGAAAQAKAKGITRRLF